MGPPDDLPGPADAGRAWAAPEAPAAGPSTLPAGPPTVASPPLGPAAPGPVGEDDATIRLPVPLRPMTLGELLDGGFAVLRAAPRTVLGLAAVFIVPVQMVVAFLNRNALEDLDRLIDEVVANPGTQTNSSVGSTWASVISFVGTSLGQTLIAGGLAIMIVAWYSGSQPTLAELLRSVIRRAPVLAVAWLFVHLLEVAGLFTLGIGSVVAMTFFLVTAPAIAVEGIGPFKGMGRASRLAGRRFWFVLGFGLLSGLVALTLGSVLALLPQFLGLLLGPDYGWIVLGVGGIITQLVTTTIVGASATLLYLDLRIRLEGLDLAWAADRHLPQ